MPTHLLPWPGQADLATSALLCMVSKSPWGLLCWSFPATVFTIRGIEARSSKGLVQTSQSAREIARAYSQVSNTLPSLQSPVAVIGMNLLSDRSFVCRGRGRSWIQQPAAVCGLEETGSSELLGTSKVPHVNLFRKLGPGQRRSQPGRQMAGEGGTFTPLS